MFKVKNKVFEVGDIVEKDGRYWTTIQTEFDAINAYELVKNSDLYRVVRGPTRQVVSFKKELKGYFVVLDIDDIRENPFSVRVNRDSDFYRDLVASIKKFGILMPITARPVKGGFEIVNGKQRYHAALDIGIQGILVEILCLTDVEMEELQIIASSHNIQTKPCEYRISILRLIQLVDNLTMPQLCERTYRNPIWVLNTLHMYNKLTETVKRLIIDGEILLANGYSLAKLPPDEQMRYLDRAMVLHPIEFSGHILARVRELKQQKRKI